MTDNPLENYFRSKEIYVKLPTDGRYFKEPVIFNSDNEIGIMPMTAKDETLLKIPDTLFSGEALYTIIKSVAPDIENPYEITIPDLDVILLATRSVTYGGKLPILGTCPHCNKSEEYELDLKKFLGMIKPIKKDIFVEVSGLNVKLKPNTAKVITAMGIAQIQSEQITMQMMKKTKEELEDLEAFKKAFEESINTITASEITIIADSIEYVEMPDGSQITDMQHIINWLTNSNSNVINTLKKYGKEQNDNGIPDKITLQCSNEECNKTFETLFDINPTFFFTGN